MSAETLNRIMNETSARLATASHGAEVQAIGLDHMTKIGADLAEALFTHFGGGSFTDAEINAAILRTREALLRSVVDSCAAFGLTTGPELELLLAASETGFLDRGEALFSLPVTGGAA